MNFHKDNRLNNKAQKRRSNDDAKQQQSNSKKIYNSFEGKSVTKNYDKIQNICMKLYELIKNHKLDIDSQLQVEISRAIKYKNQDFTTTKHKQDSQRKVNSFQQTLMANTSRIKQMQIYQSQKLQTPVQWSRQQNQQIYDKKLKVAVADYQFQIRKLTEDQATSKYLYQTQKSRMTKDYESKIQQLKKQLQEQNQNWINRFDIRDKQFKQEIQNIRIMLQKQKQKVQEQLRIDYKQHKNLIEQEKNYELKLLQKKHKQEWQMKQNERQRELNELRNQYEHRIKETIQRLTVGFEKKQREYEIKITGLNSEKKTQQRLHNNTKNEVVRLKQKYIDQIHNLKKDKIGLEQSMSSLRRQKRQLQNQINDKIKQFKNRQLQFQQKYKQLSKKSIHDLQQIKLTAKNKLLQIIQLQLKKTDQFSTTIKVLQQKHQLQNQLYTQQLQQIKNCYQQRPSKQQDLQNIKQLQYKLWKKQHQFMMACEQIKCHRLQLENKQQTYNKIFSNPYNVNQIKFPIDKNQIRHIAKDFKSRKVAKSLLIQKQLKNASGKLLQLIQPTTNNIRML